VAAWFQRPIRRVGADRYQLKLSTDERGVLRHLAPQVREALAEPEAPALRRLFPPAYAGADDKDKQEEYARLMQEDLVARHRDALEMLEQTADATELTGEQLEAWGRAINAVRLVLGTILDVSEEDNSAIADLPEYNLYEVLGYLQECAMDALLEDG
jgi:Domain of unknown function (DUF2017)